MKRKLAILSACLVVVMAFVSVALVACDKAGDDARFVRVDGKRILGVDGEPIALIGTNLGGWLVQEAYMCPTEVGYEFGQLEMMRTLANRFGKEKMYELLDVYQDNWVSEADFKNMRDLNFTAVRIPFTYLTMYDVLTLNETTNEYDLVPYADLALRDDAFYRLDWALDMCKKYGLYAILDMHGAVGSQSGMQHSGDISLAGGRLWLDNETGEICRNKTKELWLTIADRYASRSEIACYDLLNEPGVLENGEQHTTKTVWDYYDELITAIRAVDKNHAICVESCWEVSELPSPRPTTATKYDWQNVIYQYHHYNWSGNNMSNRLFYASKLTFENLMKHNVPVLIGEFNVWGDNTRDGSRSDQTDEEAWDAAIEFYCAMGWHFTTWALKANSTNTSWGLYNMKEGVSGAQVNYFEDSEERIREIWSLHNSSNYRQNEWLINAITKHIDEFNATGESKTFDFSIFD